MVRLERVIMICFENVGLEVDGVVVFMESTLRMVHAGWIEELISKRNDKVW